MARRRSRRCARPRWSSGRRSERRAMARNATGRRSAGGGGTRGGPELAAAAGFSPVSWCMGFCPRLPAAHRAGASRPGRSRCTGCCPSPHGAAVIAIRSRRFDLTVHRVLAVTARSGVGAAWRSGTPYLGQPSARPATCSRCIGSCRGGAKRVPPACCRSGA
jgi:hypothetical protein